MSFSFNPYYGLIIVRAEVEGPTRTAILRLALDTGATVTAINTVMLVTAGYNPTLATGREQITTASGVEYAAQIVARRLTVLGQVRTNFPVICHTLPPSAGIDGLLGLDFLRGFALNIDFHSGRIDLQ